MSIKNRAKVLLFAGNVMCVTLLAACAPKSSANNGATPSGTQFTLLTLERKPCFGTCPVYLLSISGDGSMTFDGKKNVNKVGAISTHIDQEKLKALQGLLDDHEFSALDDRYVYGQANCKSYASDAPTVIISVTSNGRTKSVEHDGGCSGVPSRLADLQRKIDSIANVSRYIPGAK